MKLKHQWSANNNFLTGLTADAWWKLLKRNRFSVDPVYWHRAALITVMSVLNSWYRKREENRFASEIEATEISEAPVFILGHWRSGTTHLHNLLCQDSEKFAFPNTYQVVNPHTFLTTEKVNSRRFAGFVPDKRPMDNVELNFQTPQEDEFAPCLMTLLSPYIGVAFPREEEVYERYLTFQEVSREETEEWKKAMLHMVKKLTLKYQRRLLLKSPTHTARIKLLLEVFPDARFVHIHRMAIYLYALRIGRNAVPNADLKSGLNSDLNFYQYVDRCGDLSYSLRQLSCWSHISASPLPTPLHIPHR